MKPRPHAPRPARPDHRRDDARREAPPRPESPRREASGEGPTEVVYGLRAGLALLAKRPEEIVRVAFGRAAPEDIEPLLRFCESRRLPCEARSPVDLERLAQSKHHEDLCVVARPRKYRPAAELADLLRKGRGAGLALDRVRNPYNIGAMLRTAAFFGFDAALLGAPAPHPALPPDAVRVSEGGVEHLVLSRTTDLADTLARLRSRGVRVIGADGRAEQRALGFRFERPTVLVMGHEREGMSDRVRAQCDALVSIPGSGAVESLNVAVAAGVLMAEMVR